MKESEEMQDECAPVDDEGNRCDCEGDEYECECSQNPPNEYGFEVGVNHGDGIFFIRLADKTELVVSDGKVTKEKGLTLRFPKEKFWPMFEEQMKDEKTKMLSLTFDKTELDAIMKGLDKVMEDVAKQGCGDAQGDCQ